MRSSSPRRRALSAAALALGLACSAAQLAPSVQAAPLRESASAGQSQPAPPPVVVVRPGQLPRGNHARVAWLHDDVVHTAEGGTVDLPWSKAGARSHGLRLLGHTPRGWFLRDAGGNTVSAWSARRGERNRVTSGSVSEGEILRFQLAEDRSRFLVHRFDGDRHSSLAVEDLDATLLDLQDFGGVAEVLSFSGSEAVVGVEDTQRWDVGAGTVEDLGRDAAGADLHHDLLFVTDPATGNSGPTSMVAPGEPAWTARMAQVVVSPAAVACSAVTPARATG